MDSEKQYLHDQLTSIKQEPATLGIMDSEKPCLHDQLTSINQELAALGTDPTFSACDQTTFLPLKCIGHDEFKIYVDHVDTIISTLTKEESKHRIVFEEATQTLKDLGDANPLLLRGNKQEMQKQLFNTQQQAKCLYLKSSRDLFAAKVNLNNFYETQTSFDVSEYYRVHSILLDKKNAVHKAMQVAMMRK